MLFFLCCGCAAIGHAAGTRAAGEFLFDYWETDDGLPENSATAMVQTPDGYLWFGTFNGLVRFDGVRFAVFDPGNTPELPSPGIVNLHLDRAGNLWCSTYKGMARLSNGHWTSFGAEQGWTSDFARTFAESRDGTLYVTGFDGRILRFAQGRFGELPAPPGNPRSGYLGHVDAEDYFWVAQPRFVGFWDGTAWRRVMPEPDPQQQELGAGSARDKSLWVIQKDLLRKFTRAGLVKEVKLPEPVKGFWSLMEGGSGDLWICSYSDGVYRVSPNGSVDHYTTASGLPYHAVRFVFEDREQNYWVGTSGGGLTRIKPRTFQTFASESGLTERVVKSVAVDSSGNVFVGTYGQGVARFDGRQMTAVALPVESDRSVFVQALLQDRAGSLWVGTFGDGLYRLTPTASRRIPSEDIGGEIVAAMLEDSRGRLWIASGAQVTVQQADAFTPVGRLRDGSALGDVRAFAEEPSSGAILAANERGLFRFEANGFVEVKDSGGRSIEQVLCMKTRPDGSLWLGTASSGLVRFREGFLSPVGQAQGLPIRTVTTILDDQLGHWWLGSNRGILRADPRQLEAAADGRTTTLEEHLFTVSDGLASIECPGGYQPTAARGPDGRLWFATLKGVAVVDPRRVRINVKPPPVVIESASFVDAKRRPQRLELDRSAPVRLPPGSSQLDVEFTGLSFTAPEKMKFSYRLERETRLIATEEMSRRTVSLKLLPPGKYTLQVTASNNDGMWNREGATLSFMVLPFFWQTLWFRLGTFAALAGLFGALFWRAAERRVRIQREKFEQQKALAEEKARLASVLEGTSDLVGFATPRGQILYINPAGRKLLGLRPDEEVTRLEIREFHPPAANDVLLQTALPTAIRDGTWSGETVLRRHGGGEIPVSQVLLAHKDAGGTVLFLSTIIRDITESQKLEEQLRQSQKMQAIGTLASGIAHDFNNVLCAIIGNIELARQDVGSNHPAAESLQEARQASNRAKDLVQQLLTFGRQRAFERRVISLCPIVREAVKLLRATLPAGVKLVTTTAPDTPNVLADASQIHQVLLNLCTNAWHAMEDCGGCIEIRLGALNVDSKCAGADLRPGRYARLSVSDTGQGMDAATLERIFEPFFTTKALRRGTGLGLAVVHGIVKSHEGTITVTSQPGRGTTFHLCFPATDAKAEVAEPEREGPSLPHGRSQHILYLDDEEPLVLLVVRTLERLGYRVSGFTQASEALAAFRNDPSQYDLVVTDFNMPGMSGLDMVCHLLRLRPGLPVLLTSGYLSEQLKANARAAGVSGLIYKPNTVDELGEAVQRFIGEIKQP
ncbi:MAG: ATP-binding protein [Verrucomicrobiales bacterium]|nr:ATP-binding protein [Verrucomicrobiales bacterium]